MRGEEPGIGIDSGGRYFFVVEAYAESLKRAFDELEADLNGS